MTTSATIRIAATTTLAALSLLLTGCFITPGKFASELTLGADESFAFSYEGEIFFLGLSSLSQMGAASETFEPEACFDEETFEERPCTPGEIASQRADWDAGAEARAAEAKRKAEQLSAMMGGIDPSDPEANAELARLLLRHEGWERVEPRGDGVFDVSYRTAGRMTHDFAFPSIEGFAASSPFVQMFVRKGRVVRINAPGFAPQQGDSPMGPMMGGMAGLAGLAALSGDDAAGGEAMPDIPQIEGTFAITVASGMAIRANNTDEGPEAVAGGEILRWDISPRTSSAPTALIAY